METKVLKVKGMSCSHCINSITMAVKALPGIGDLNVNLKTGKVTLEYDPEQSPLDKIKFEIEKQGYGVVDE